MRHRTAQRDARLGDVCVRPRAQPRPACHEAGADAVRQIYASLYEWLGIVTVEAQVSWLPTFVSEGAVETSLVFRRLDLADGSAAWAQAVLSEPAAACVSRVDDVRAHGFRRQGERREAPGLVSKGKCQFLYKRMNGQE